MTQDSDRELRWPTPREFVDEWEQATDGQRLARAERIIQDAQLASACFVKNHADLEREVYALRAALVDAIAGSAEPGGER